MNNKAYILLILIMASGLLKAQELNCSVQVLTPQIQSSDKKIYETLKTSIYEFMNTRKWTNNEFLNQERIECSVTITISERLSVDEFKATIQVISRRPIYKTSYSSQLFNFNDPDLQFKYTEYQPLDFNEATYQSNLTSTLAFYAYILIGLDYDSFSMMGGTPYLQKAVAVANNAQNADEKGWKPYESTKNRYWLSQNLLNTDYGHLREIAYRYHHKALDIMSEKPDDARTEVKNCVDMLKALNNEFPNAFLVQLFFASKVDELVNIFSKAFPDEKNAIINELSEIDPSNALRYQGILKE